MIKKFSPAPEDIQLFRNAMKGVQPLKKKSSQTILKPFEKAFSRPQPHKTATIPDLADATEYLISAEEKLLFARPGVQHRVLRKLRQGQFPISAQLDLHGKTITTARQTLGHFLENCRKRQVRCALIVHGKGKTAQTDKPILKNQVYTWLQQADNVLAFCSAKPRDGGAGAVYVLFSRSR